MDKISIADALEFAEQNFPNAPEKLAEFLKIEVRRTALNCDGWCLQLGNRSIIRINKNDPEVRQRFTLAHELGHLIYGVPTVVGESILTFSKRNSEERKIDKFAAELLLPTSKVLKAIQEIPITASVLQKFAKKAKVSPFTVALRVAGLANQLGLNDASVVLYKNDKFKWQWSETLKLNDNTPNQILAECNESAPNPARIACGENEVIVASFIENPSWNTKVLFLQLVNETDGYKPLREERIRELETYLFEGDVKFRQSMAGRFGAFKSIAQNVFLNDAIQLFNERILRNPELINTKKLRSEKGREYIRLKLEAWTKK